MQLRKEAQLKPSMSAAWGRMAFALLLCLLAAQTGYASNKGSGKADGPHAKLSRELRNFKGTDPVNVIVQFRGRPTAAHYKFLATNGGKLKNNKALRHMNSVALRLSP